MTWQRIDHEAFYQNGETVLPKGAPFDGKSVLIVTPQGVCEAWWMNWEIRPTLEDPNNGDGWLWVCCDNQFQCDWDEITWWMPIPDLPEGVYPIVS